MAGRGGGLPGGARQMQLQQRGTGIMALRPPPFPLLLLLFFSVNGVGLFWGAPTAGAAAVRHDPASPSGGQSTIVFNTLGRSRYSFDAFSLPVPPLAASAPLNSIVAPDELELRLTDGESVNYNGFFPADTYRLLSLLPTAPPHPFDDAQMPLHALVYVSERNGSSNVYLDVYPSPSVAAATAARRVQLPLLRPDGDGRVSMKDRPSVAGEHLVYVSTHEDSGVPRRSWAAVYSTHLPSGETRRLTPRDVVDFSPAVSPSGEWTAVASWGDRSWAREDQDLRTDIYVFRTRDGSGRTKLVHHGGWPCWADDSTLFFHRESEDGWWSVYRAVVGEDPTAVGIYRVTPPGFHAFTPSAGRGFVAFSTRRPTSDFRHIELLDLARNMFVEVTKPISPNSHHYNPFVSPDSTRIGYHRCRGGRTGAGASLMLERIDSPLPDVSLFRIDGSFPSFSPDGDRIAFAGLPGLYVMNSDGSNQREILPDFAFPAAWDRKRKGVLYTSIGPGFASDLTEVDVVSVTLPDEGEEAEPEHTLSALPLIKKLTTGGANNAFPSPSPDGKWVVFRSGRSGHKNLYIMDAAEGEKASLRRLTNGPWIDTMCTWSPDGEWIAFSSNRDDTSKWGFSLYLVHPNGTGLRKVFHNAGGRADHPSFSPDSQRIVFTSDYAGVSSEPVANGNSALPYGEIYVVGVDGSGLQRLTHNGYEDGTAAWSGFYMETADVVGGAAPCDFADCEWLDQGGAPSKFPSVGAPRPRCAKK